MAGNQELGRAGEERAATWYVEHGYEVLDRNWRLPSGEIDLVCCRNGVVVFCEVKTRSSTRFGRGLEAVDRRKQRRIRALATQWLQQRTGRYTEIRFDVADVDGQGNIEVIEGCF